MYLTYNTCIQYTYIYICMYITSDIFFIIIHTILNILLHTSIFLMCRFSAPLLFDSDFSPSGQFQPLRNISAPLVSWKLPIKKDLHTNTLVQKNQWFYFICLEIRLLMTFELPTYFFVLLIFCGVNQATHDFWVAHVFFLVTHDS